MEDLLNPDTVHEWLASLEDNDPSFLIAGINEDDCAVIKINKQQVVITTDYLNSNPICKQLGIATDADLGKLLVAANLSDLLGSGAKPISFLASIMLKKGSKLIQFQNIIKGVLSELNKYNIPLVGGDTKLGESDALCGTAIGICQQQGNIFLKNRAEAEDSIWVSGEIGNTGAAVVGLKNNLMSNEWMQWAKTVLTTPNLPYYKSIELSALGLGKGGTDISDGLSENLYDMCETSGVGAIIYVDKIPISSAVEELSKEIQVPAWHFAFSIGGDFQFLVTSDSENDLVLEKLGFSKIGKITKNRSLEINVCDKISILPRTGHTDFKIESYSNEIENMLHTLQANLG